MFCFMELPIGATTLAPLDTRGHKMRTKKKNNIFRGFNFRILEEAFNIDSSKVTRFLGQDDYRNDIIRVKGKLDLVNLVIRPSQESEHKKQYEIRGSHREGARVEID